jgi:hypothetical protein
MQTFFSQSLLLFLFLLQLNAPKHVWIKMKLFVSNVKMNVKQILSLQKIVVQHALVTFSITLAYLRATLKMSVLKNGQFRSFHEKKSCFSFLKKLQKQHFVVIFQKISKMKNNFFFFKKSEMVIFQCLKASTIV